MHCPFCGKDMEAGWLYGRSLWSAKQGKASIHAGKEDVSLIPDRFAVTPASDFPAAHICRDCRKIVVEY